MAQVYNWYGTASSCPDAANPQIGWYAGSNFVTSSYRNPSTGLAYTPAELGGLTGGSTPSTPSTPSGTPNPNYPTTGYGINPNSTGENSGLPTYQQWFMQQQQQGNYSDLSSGDPVADYEAYISGQGSSMPATGSQYPVAGAGAPGQPGGMPAFGEGAAAGIPSPEVSPAPPYEVSPEMQEMMDLYGGKVTDWVESGGYGLSPEVQAQMIQLQTDSLKAREAENIRVTTNNMERRGITNSGYLQASKNMISSNTSKEIAGAIANVQIKSALMKMESFEKGMGAMANFLGFMSEQSQLAYAPEFATWQAEQMAKMQTWQGKMDIYKMELNQAYQTQNTLLQAEIQSQLNNEQHQFNIELAEMEIESNNKIAMSQGIGGIFGTILGFIFGK